MQDKYKHSVRDVLVMFHIVHHDNMTPDSGKSKVRCPLSGVNTGAPTITDNKFTFSRNMDSKPSTCLLQQTCDERLQTHAHMTAKEHVQTHFSQLQAQPKRVKRLQTLFSEKKRSWFCGSVP